MLEIYLRPAYQKWLVNPVATLIQRNLRQSAQIITLCAGVCGILSAIVLVGGFTYFAVCLLLISGYCDTLDGTIARIDNKTTPMGAVLDIITDRIVEFAIIFALFTLNPAGHGFAALAMLGSILICVSSFLVVGIFTENTSQKSFHYSPGLMERAEAFIFFVIMMLKPNWFNGLAWLFSGLVFYTALVRIYQFYKIQKR